ncbi:MAG: acyl-CoA dehydrogenase [Caulobacter sp.]|nr:acyl-CoA dehydrogenase [Caulobacter sp.]
MSDHAAFRQTIQAFLVDKLTPELKAANSRQAGVFADAELSRRWHSILYDQGWIAPNWPVEHGGPGWDPVERFIFQDESARAGAPYIPVIGTQMCGPVIMRYGTDAQKARFLPAMLSGEHYWCQGYSEPGAGSDLAALKTRADLSQDGTHYVVNGSKIWTTHAHKANWMFMLVRTSQEAKPQAGISFLLTPMDAPGITVQPIISISGEHELNAVFFDNVRVPVENRVGEENAGWGVAKYLLEFERGAGAAAGRIRRFIDQARIMAQAEGGGGGASFWDENPDFRARLAQLEIEVLGLEFSEREVAAKLAAGQPIGATSSLLKLGASTLLQRATELNVEALGVYAMPDQRAALGFAANTPPVGPDYAATPMAKYLNTRAATIYGGSYEVQHNILARVIGL